MNRPCNTSTDGQTFFETNWTGADYIKRKTKVQIEQYNKKEKTHKPNTKPLNKHITPVMKLTNPLKYTPNMKLKIQTMRTTWSSQTP